MKNVSDRIWVVKTTTAAGNQYHYAAVEKIEDVLAAVRGIIGTSTENIRGVLRVKNVDKVPDSEIRLVPEGDYSGPLIP